MTRNTIMGRIVAVKENQVSIKLDLISIGNPLFDFSGSVTRPKIMNSKKCLLLPTMLKMVLESCKDQILFRCSRRHYLNIMEELGNDTFTAWRRRGSFLFNEPFITDENISD
ncbi:hypothetical protein BDF21DRAFT_499034 [Thamnidium elegans]|nr:hypothetical protein BDF21DRAFT_499034 [Thamnidium elegans]